MPIWKRRCKVTRSGSRDGGLLHGRLTGRFWLTGSIVALVLGAAIAGAAWGQSRSAPDRTNTDEVRARRFILVDSAGAERAELAVTVDGSARLVVRDAKGKTAVWVGINSAGDPSLSIVDSQGLPYADLVMYRDEPRLALCSPPGKPRAGIVVSKTRGPRIDLLDDNGRPRASLDPESLFLFRPDGSVLWRVP